MLQWAQKTQCNAIGRRKLYGGRVVDAMRRMKITWHILSRVIDVNYESVVMKYSAISQTASADLVVYLTASNRCWAHQTSKPWRADDDEYDDGLDEYNVDGTRFERTILPPFCKVVPSGLNVMHWRTIQRPESQHNHNCCFKLRHKHLKSRLLGKLSLRISRMLRKGNREEPSSNANPPPNGIIFHSIVQNGGPSARNGATPTSDTSSSTKTGMRIHTHTAEWKGEGLLRRRLSATEITCTALGANAQMFVPIA